MIHEPPRFQSQGFSGPFLKRPLLMDELHLSVVETDWRISRLRDHIDMEYGKLGLNLDRLCQRLDLRISGSHAAKLFKRQFGVGIRDYTTRKRLIAAAEKLKTTKLSVREIAADLGYKRQTDLQRQFKRLFSLNPSQFRRAKLQADGENKRHTDSTKSVSEAET